MIRGSLEAMSGSARREMMISDVIDGVDKHCARILEPMKPDIPASINFILVMVDESGKERYMCD